MKKIKKYMQYALVGAASLALMPALSSCDDDDDNSDADPVISYIRPTDPASSDSLLAAASLGQVIAIMGDNLDNIRALSFNDQEVTLNTCYMQEHSLIVTVPTAIPERITDSLYITASNGNVIRYPFVSTIPSPVVNSVSTEQVKEGDVIYVNGNFFVATETTPVSLTFNGNVNGEYLPEQSSYTRAAFKVPAGVQPGVISVSTAYGTSTPSSGIVYINDDRSEYMLIDFDKFAFNGWGKTAIVDGDFGKCAYLHSAEVDLWSWDENTTMLFSNTGEGQPHFVSPATKPEDGYLKFEIKVDQPWTAVALYFEFQTPSQSTNNQFGTNPGYCWEPWKAGAYTTDGWATVSIPLSNFNQTTDGKGSDAGVFPPSQIDGLNLFVRGGTGAEGSLTAVSMYLDNFRIVPAE